MAKKYVSLNVKEIDPLFFIPEGVDELAYVEENEYDTDGVVELDEDFYTEDDVDYSDAPATPNVLGIVSQTIKTTAAGVQLVDIVIEVEDIDNISNYDFRVTKI